MHTCAHACRCRCSGCSARNNALVDGKNVYRHMHRHAYRHMCRYAYRYTYRHAYRHVYRNAYRYRRCAPRHPSAKAPIGQGTHRPRHPSAKAPIGQGTNALISKHTGRSRALAAATYDRSLSQPNFFFESILRQDPLFDQIHDRNQYFFTNTFSFRFLAVSPVVVFPKLRWA